LPGYADTWFCSYGSGKFLVVTVRNHKPDRFQIAGMTLWIHVNPCFFDVSNYVSDSIALLPLTALAIVTFVSDTDNPNQTCTREPFS
jgi:hypothetical protein